MSIKIRQMCDSCGRDRDLKVSPTGAHRDLAEAASADGWVDVGLGSHLCITCIREAVGKPLADGRAPAARRLPQDC